MSTIRVANVHFESTGTNRIDYLNDNKIRFNSANGAVFSGSVEFAGITVQKGNLLESNGDGCARVQVDDIIRSSTIGKVTTNIPVETYEDGSYTVPCVLYCG